MCNFDKNKSKKVFWSAEHFRMLAVSWEQRAVPSILVNCRLGPLPTGGTDGAGTQAPATQDRTRVHALAPRCECTSDSEPHRCAHAHTCTCVQTHALCFWWFTKKTERYRTGLCGAAGKGLLKSSNIERTWHFCHNKNRPTKHWDKNRNADHTEYFIR